MEENRIRLIRRASLQGSFFFRRPAPPRAAPSLALSLVSFSRFSLASQPTTRPTDDCLRAFSPVSSTASLCQWRGARGLSAARSLNQLSNRPQLSCRRPPRGCFGTNATVANNLRSLWRLGVEVNRRVFRAKGHVVARQRLDRLLVCHAEVQLADGSAARERERRSP